MRNLQTKYFNENSHNLTDTELEYDNEFKDSKHIIQTNFSNFFLNKVREIVFCRIHKLPTKEKEKKLKEFRNLDINNK